jgi:ketosteroid isomerase-like protein
MKEREMSAKNKETVNKVNESFAEGSIEGFLSLCTDDLVWTMIGKKSVKGKNAVREWLASVDAEPPKFTVDNIIGEGDFVTAYGEMTMKEKDGRTAPYAYCDIYRFRNGKIAELNSFVIKAEARAQTAGRA